jgi:hypothetical protein
VESIPVMPEDRAVMDRALSVSLFAVAVLCFGGAVLLLLNGFIEYLQAGSWKATSLLQFCYDAHLIRARWFLANDWSWWIHDALKAVPGYAVLLVLSPAAWWLSGVVSRR